ncbi:unnamed protein product [Phytomonas sp. Hart1]|nr:unnamed protein product [Phytomonas sp. Hart1]|eukprot:CCW66121.1 unnamed protein product [Phytomonas sp. isolate Hart1]
MRDIKCIPKTLFGKIIHQRRATCHISSYEALPLSVTQYTIPASLTITRKCVEAKQPNTSIDVCAYLVRFLHALASLSYTKTGTQSRGSVVPVFAFIESKMPSRKYRLPAINSSSSMTSTLIVQKMRLHSLRKSVILNFSARRDLNTKSTDDSNVSVTTLCERRTTACSKWYAKQANQNFMFPEDILHVDSEYLLNFKSQKRPPSSIDMFLGCLRVADSMNWDLSVLFKQIPFLVKIEVICRVLQRQDKMVRDETCSTCLTLEHMLQTILREATAKLGDEAWLVRVIMHLDETHVGTVIKDFTMLRQLLKMSLFLSPISILPHIDPDRLIYHVLQLGERVFDGCWQEWSDALAEAGLRFEACAYAYAESPRRFLEPQREPSLKGFGNAVLEALTQSQLLIEAVQKLGKRMPRNLAHYTYCLAALSIIRQPHKSFQCSCYTERHISFPFDLLETSMSRLEFASLIHFTLFSGNCHTAHLLLAQCATPKEIARVMQHTRDAGNFLSLTALREMLSRSPSECAYVVLHLAETEAPLLFDVKAHCVDLEMSVCFFSTQPGGIQRTRAKMATHQWREIYKVLQDVLPLSVLSTGCQSLEILLKNVPITAIPFLVRTFSPFTSELVSWWASLYIHSGNEDAAMKLLSCSLSRNVLPEVWVLVELLEFHRNHEKNFKSCVELIRTQFAGLSTAVFRAFVERTAYHRGVGLSDKSMSEQALDLLSSVAILGLSHYPVVCIQQILEKASTPVVGAILQLIKDGESKTFGNSPAPLQVDVVERLVAAAHTLGLSPKLDVYVVFGPSKELTWWSSHGLPCTKCAVHRLYNSGTTGLWPLVFGRIHSLSRLNVMEAHQAVRLMAVGCDNSKTVCEAVCASQDYLLGDSSLSRPLKRQNESTLIMTLACVASSLTARGEWRAALQLISPSVKDLPPLLRILKFQALLQDPQAREFAEMNLADSIHAFVEGNETAKAYRYQPLLYKGRWFPRTRFHERLPRAVLRKRSRVDRPWQSYLTFTKSLKRLLAKCGNNVLVAHQPSAFS